FPSVPIPRTRRGPARPAGAAASAPQWPGDEAAGFRRRSTYIANIRISLSSVQWAADCTSRPTPFLAALRLSRRGLTVGFVGAAVRTAMSGDELMGFVMNAHAAGADRGRRPQKAVPQ